MTASLIGDHEAKRRKTTNPLVAPSATIRARSRVLAKGVLFGSAFQVRRAGGHAMKFVLFVEG